VVADAGTSAALPRFVPTANRAVASQGSTAQTTVSRINGI
jgi:hypothetical protein